MSTSMYNILKFLYREYGHDYERIQNEMCGYGVDEGGFVRVSAVYCDKEDKNHHNY